MKKKKRGITKVPNIRYADRNKFAFGAVLQVHGINYYIIDHLIQKSSEISLVSAFWYSKIVLPDIHFNYEVKVYVQI